MNVLAAIGAKIGEKIGAIIDRYWMAPAPAARLGVVRVLVGGFAAVYMSVRLPSWLSYAHFDPVQFRPVGVVAWLCDAPLPPWAVIALAVLAALCAWPFLLGWRFRLFGPLFAVLCLWTLSYRHSFGMVFHTDNLLVWHLLILGVTRSADAWSIDSRRHGAPADHHGWHGRYGWPLRLMCWTVVIAYVLAGVAKLENGGMAWMWGDELRNHIAIDNARKIMLGDIYSPLAAPLMRWDWPFRVLAAMTVILELGAPCALLARRLAAAWVILIIGFHLGVLALMMIAFPYQMLGFAFACFFRVDRPARRLRDWLRARRVAIRGSRP
jgi:hypothetical protein